MTLEKTLKRIALLVCLLFSVAAFTQEHEHAPKVKNATFEKLKTVLGDWESKEGNMTFHVNYMLVSNGTAIMETMSEGAGKAPMINMYSPDGGKLAMVHYCSEGNQPHMRADAPNGNDIAFNFIDIVNLPDPKAEHMHTLTLRIVDADHIEQHWTSMHNDKSESYVFKLTRVKSAS